MYSKARISGHAAHAMVVVFPIALFTSTVVMLLAYVRTRDAFYFRGAMVADIAGVITALIAMIPGALDMLALPRRARARALAYRHASSALIVTSVFAVAGGLLYRDWAGRVMVNGRWALDPTIPLALAVLGLVVLVGAATAGWSLVQTHHLGIKPARVHADRPSREPELDDEAAIEAAIAPAAARMGTAPKLRVVRP
jgi:uncharacterized membrane protein